MPTLPPLAYRRNVGSHKKLRPKTTRKRVFVISLWWARSFLFVQVFACDAALKKRNIPPNFCVKRAWSKFVGDYEYALCDLLFAVDQMLRDKMHRRYLFYVLRVILSGRTSQGPWFPSIWRAPSICALLENPNHKRCTRSHQVQAAILTLVESSTGVERNGTLPGACMNTLAKVAISQIFQCTSKY